MQGVELLRVALQYLPVEGARLLQPALLVQGDGLAEQGVQVQANSMLSSS
nr:hypothetical protein [Massilia sp. Bi118]